MNSESDFDPTPSTGNRGLRVVEGAGRSMPHSLEAEAALLACCLMDGGPALGQALDAQLVPASFYHGAHGTVFRTLAKLHRRGQAVDVAVLAEELKAAGKLDAVGGYAGLATLTEAVPTTAQLTYFIDKVRELWIRREIIKHATAAAETAHDAAEPVRELLETQQGKWSAMLDYVRAEDESMTQRAARAAQRTRDRIAGKADVSRRLYTGLREFDERYGAFDVLEEDWLVGLGAVTSGGKSALSRQWTNAFLEAGKTGLVFLLETSIGKWFDLSAATAARVNGRDLERLPRDLAEKFLVERDRREAWLGKKLWLYDDPIKAETICARVEEHARQHGRPDFVVIDHLHELTSTQNFKGFRSLEIAHIAKLLKRTAKRLDVTFFLPLQLNRGPGKEDREPSKHDIRDSGEVENALDRFILIHTPKEDMRGAEQTENQLRVMVKIIQAKSRNGPLGRREFWFDRNFTRFSDIGDRDLGAMRPPPGTASGTPPTRKTKADYMKGGR